MSGIVWALNEFFSFFFSSYFSMYFRLLTNYKYVFFCQRARAKLRVARPLDSVDAGWLQGLEPAAREANVMKIYWIGYILPR